MSSSNEHPQAPPRPMPIALRAGALAALLLLRVPIMATEHRQEDAFISLRCAVNLAETGFYGFNPGEVVSASTSHAYVFLAALLKLSSPRLFLELLSWLNVVLFLSGLALLVCSIVEERRARWLVFCTSALLPVGLEIANSAMETSLLFALLGLVVFSERRNGKYPALMASFVPWVRPDAAVFPLLLAIFRIRSDRRRASMLVAGVLIGGLALVLFNLAVFGAPFHQSIAAKWVAGGSHRTLSERAQGALLAIFGGESGGAFAPLPSRFLDGLQWLFLIPLIGLWAGFVRRGDLSRDGEWVRHWVVAAAVVPPLLYGLGGVVFPWYLWPSVLLGYVAAVAEALRLALARGRGWRWAIGATLVLALVGGYAARLALSYRWGVLEAGYRAGIGRFLHELEQPEATLLLEPAGYIPFYSGLYTADEVGLVCPAVSRYRKLYGQDWWSRFLTDKRPTFLVERPHMREGVTLDGYKLPAAEFRRFQEEYERIRTFSFHPGDYAPGGLSALLLRLGAASDYDVYRRRGESASASDRICL